MLCATRNGVGPELCSSNVRPLELRSDAWLDAVCFKQALHKHGTRLEPYTESNRCSVQKKHVITVLVGL